MKAEKIGRCVYSVESEGSGDLLDYQVDLLSFDGNGECSCLFFEKKCLTHAEEGYRNIHIGALRTTCKHIMRAREVFVEESLKQLSKNEQL